MDFASRNRFKMWKMNGRYKTRPEAGRSKEKDLLIYHF